MSNKRAELRRLSRKQEKDSKVRYSLTAAELDEVVRRRVTEVMNEEIESLRLDVMEDSIGNALVLLLTIPMVVLKEHYWQKTYSSRLPKFADQMIDILNKWENDEIDLEKLRQEVWKDAGLKFDRDFVERTAKNL